MSDTAPTAPDPVHLAPRALWQIAESFLNFMFVLFGAPEEVAASHTLSRKLATVRPAPRTRRLSASAAALERPVPHTSITRLRLRSLFSLGAFARETREISAQLSAAPGFLGGAVLAEGRLVFWTRSAWASLDAMKAFRDSGAHRASMPKIQDWCDEAAVVQSEGEPLTDWDAIYALLVEKGRLTRLKRPNAAHEAKQFAKMLRWSPEQPIKPLKT